MAPRPDCILIVDDDADTRRVWVDVLTWGGFSVDEAVHGEDALRHMEEHHYAVVVCDHQMPVMNGLEFLPLARAAAPATPVIMLSGADPDLADVARRKGAYTWLQKPCSPRALLHAIQAAMAQHECRATATTA
jgi:two-component system C4-dicarboxylate transport response regulator DctD